MTRASSNLPTIQRFLAFAEGDELGMVLRSHLALETLLNYALSDATSHLELKELDRLAFGAKVAVGAALGKVPPHLLEGFELASRVRNAFAHDLETTITADQARQLMNALHPEVIGQSFVESYRESLSLAPKDQVAFAFAALFVYTAIYSDLDDHIFRMPPGPDGA